MPDNIYQVMYVKKYNEEFKKEDANMAKTPDNLKEAFAGESQANRKYLAFSKKAKSRV